MIKKAFLLGAMTLSLQGCFYAKTTQAPIAQSYPLTEQKKMQAMHHWQVLADYEAKGIIHQLKDQPVYVVPGNTDTVFDKTFREMLTSELVQDGATVMLTPTTAAEITYDVSLVEHKDQGHIRQPEGTYTALAAGIGVLSLAADWTEPGLVALPFALVADALAGNLVDESDTEIAITTRVSEGGRLLHSSTNIYYINSGDKAQYAAPAKTTRTIRVTDR
ncbi:hypothetical protein Q4583_16990 [Neptunomonas phycophila]|jgi:hypothetical protein|uniref:Lipoprotein n=1 Tax=Neptunomonas phycophila TaxID=1572645 RepID=A0AAW7XRB7_9GAMM|nr:MULTISPECIES: hypothetical protein [Neptunomonas]MBT3147259.1 hypothetical protein [Neptunomonas phycophila]MDN2659967.1 hypothetical protein [Neptunomonas sp. CHC150]MDO6455310.1 hypothetical protein [Neptunomonas phycophila]MDO6469867.1 hypothetical protein [Neptunomonas phycophila]MDO6785812.1 hypothetical protein [Neptunomonas phycophila]